jgi:ribonuclease BN (tRNA processing enzyme)
MIERLLPLVLALLPLQPAPQAGASRAPAPDARPVRTRVVLLGTGTPACEPDRAGPSLAVVVDDVAYLVDCGPGVVRRATAAWSRGIHALEPRRLERVFLTHLHSDHTLGLPDLVFSPWVLGRSAPLEVFGPPGTKAMTEHVVAAWSADVTVRTEGLEELPPAGGAAVAHEIEPGVVYRDERVVVRAFAVPHGTWKHAYGYRFETPDRTIVVSGDTAPSEELARMASGVDVLVHEVYSADGFALLPPGAQAYHSSFHTSTRELAELATEAKPKLLVLTHQLFGGPDAAAMARELKRHYAGEVVSGRDLDVF